MVWEPEGNMIRSGALFVKWGTVNWRCARRLWQSLGMGQLGRKVCGKQGRRDGQREAPSTARRIYLFDYGRPAPHTLLTELRTGVEKNPRPY